VFVAVKLVGYFDQRSLLDIQALFTQAVAIATSARLVSVLLSADSLAEP